WEEGERIWKRGERGGVRAEIHLALAVPDRERRALAGADQKILLAIEQERECEGAVQPRQRCRDRLERAAALLHLLAHEMGDDFRIGVGLELRALRAELLAQFAEILDDAVVDDGDALGRMGMRVGLVRPTVGRPSRVRDPDPAAQRLPGKPRLEVLQLALGAAAPEMPAFEGSYTSGIIAAV